jgi:type IV secretory pathway VirB2 component (pilin)
MRPREHWILALGLAAFLMPVAAHAQGVDPNTIAQNIETFMTGAWGKSIAAVAFGCVGLVAWWGYMSWATAAKAVMGGVCLFSAPWFVQTFFGQ